MCGSASGGIKIVRLIFAPTISFRKSPSIGVVAKTFILSTVVSSTVVSSVVVPLPHAIRITDSKIATILNVGLNFI